MQVAGRNIVPVKLTFLTIIYRFATAILSISQECFQFTIFVGNLYLNAIGGFLSQIDIGIIS